MGGANDADLFTGPKRKDNATLEKIRLLSAFQGQTAREFEHCGTARRVVVRAVVDLAFLASAFERAGIAASKVIVMSADQNIFRMLRITCGRKHGQDVVVSLPDLLHASRDSHLDLRDRESAIRARVLRVEGGLKRVQIFAGRSEHCGSDFLGNAGSDNARARETGIEGERRELAGVG